MAIGNAVQKSNVVFVYDPKGRQLFTKSGDLHGFTGGTVVIRKANMLFTYDEKGRQIASTSAR